MLDVLASPRRQWALLLALGALCRIELALRSKPLAEVCTELGLKLLAPSADDDPTPARGRSLASIDAWAIAALARRWPMGGGCLRYALVMGQRLARLSPSAKDDTPPQLMLGARRTQQGELDVHAWLLHAGKRYDLWPLHGQRAFVPLRRTRAT